MYAGCPILWTSKRQQLIALSATTEAEYIALSSALREVIRIIHLIEELRQPEFDRKLHMEPIGEYYQLHEEWERMTGVLKIHYNYQRTVRKIDVPLTCCPCLEDEQRTGISFADRSDHIAINDEAATLNLPAPPPTPPPTDLPTPPPPTNLPTPPPPTNLPTPPTPTNLPTPPPPPHTNLPTPPLHPPPTPNLPTTPDVFEDTSYLDDYDVDEAIREAGRLPPPSPTPTPPTNLPTPPQHPPPTPNLPATATAPPPPQHPPQHPPALVQHYQQYMQQLDGPDGEAGDEQAQFSRRLHNHNNVGYSCEKWGGRRPPVSTATLQNTYIQKGPLTVLQSKELDSAVSEVYRKHGDTLNVTQWNQLIADEFNTKHLAAGGAGFGGKISPRRVQKETTRRVQSVYASRLPPQPLYPPYEPAALTETDLAVGQRRLRHLCKKYNLSQFGASDELRSRLRSRFNLPDPSTPGPSTPGPSTPGPSTPGPSTPGPPIDPYDLTELRGTTKEGDDDVSEFF